MKLRIKIVTRKAKSGKYHYWYWIVVNGRQQGKRAKYLCPVQTLSR